MWVALWAVLVVGTGVGAFLLGRDLLRKGRGLVAEIDRSAEVLDLLDARLVELGETMASVPQPPVLLETDPTERELRRSALRATRERLREARAAATQLRADAAFARWRSMTRP